MKLKIENLSKWYGGTPIFRNVDLTLNKGVVAGVVGPNGAGKTTLLDVISGLKSRSTGTITVDGSLVKGASPTDSARHGVMRSFQEVRVFPSLSVRENVVAGSDVKGRSGWMDTLSKEMLFDNRDPVSTLDHARTLSRLLEAYGLQGMADVPARELSYGQKKLVELCRLSARDGDVVLLDEPVAGLADEAFARVQSEIERWRRHGKIVLVVEHERKLLSTVAELMLRLNRNGLGEI